MLTTIPYHVQQSQSVNQNQQSPVIICGHFEWIESILLMAEFMIFHRQVRKQAILHFTFSTQYQQSLDEINNRTNNIGIWSEICVVVTQFSLFSAE